MLGPLHRRLPRVPEPYSTPMPEEPEPPPTSDGLCPGCLTEAHWVVAQGSDRFFGKTTDQFSLVECCNCGLVRLNPFPTEVQLKAFSNGLPWWESTQARESRILRALRAMAFRGQVRFILGTQVRRRPTLDLSGRGAPHVSVLQDLGLAVEKADIANVRVQQARIPRAGPATAAAGAVAGYARRSFGTIVALHVVEHLRDPWSALAMLRDLLDDDGSIIVQVPDASSWEALLLGERWNGFDIPRHPVSFREEDLEALLEACGYQVLRRKRFWLAQGPAGLATSLCPGLAPAVRHGRGMTERGFLRVLKDLAHRSIVVGVMPLTLLAALAGIGSSIMMEARKADR